MILGRAKNLNDGFDAEGIYYFSEKDFEIVLDRVETHNIGICGIEPWLNGMYFGVTVVEDFKTTPDDASWYRQAFEAFKGHPNLMYAATYDVPKERLK